MSTRDPQFGASVFAATCCAQAPAPDVTVALGAELASMFRAQAELHRVLRDAAPQRRVVAGLLVNALLGSATSAGDGGEHDLDLRLWRLPGRLHVDLRATMTLRIDDRSRLLLDRFAELWEEHPTMRLVRVEIRTTLSAPPRVRLAEP